MGRKAGRKRHRNPKRPLGKKLYSTMDHLRDARFFIAAMLLEAGGEVIVDPNVLDDGMDYSIKKTKLPTGDFKLELLVNAPARIVADAITREEGKERQENDGSTDHQTTQTDPGKPAEMA